MMTGAPDEADRVGRSAAPRIPSKAEAAVDGVAGSSCATTGQLARDVRAGQRTRHDVMRNLRRVAIGFATVPIVFAAVRTQRNPENVEAR
jgi:hypothetical protein